MNKGKHSYLIMGLVAVGAVLYLRGNVGGSGDMGGRDPVRRTTRTTTA